MFCPHCHNKIPDGSNICPLCYGSLAGMKIQSAPKAAGSAETAQPRPKKKSSKNSRKAQAYTKGSRGAKKNADRTPMIIAFGLILILLIIIVLIIRSMFGAGTPQAVYTPAPQVQAVTTPEGGFIVFGQATRVPTMQVVTATPRIEVTATPAPTPVASYATLRKGDQGPEVVTLQQALTELGYLNGAADGNFGTGTQTAVKKFQEDNGLDADGIAGKMTQEALYAKSSVTPIPETTVGPGDIMDLPG